MSTTTTSGNAPPRRLPVPFYQVLEQELRGLRAVPARTDSERDWLLTPEDLVHVETLQQRWDQLELEKLWTEKHRDKKPSPPGGEVMAQERNEQDLTDKLNDLIDTEKPLTSYHSFPKHQLSRTTARLARSFPRQPTEAELPQLRRELCELNRLLLEALFPDNLRKAYDAKLDKAYAQLRGKQMSALCFSGGGIRSATFCLGVLQGLAKNHVLSEFDYLSTVSGGGYIGSWLSTWLHHHGGKPEAVFEQLNLNNPEAGIHTEASELVHLRKYSNYLAPRLGLLSADTWVLIGTYIRNLLLNWVVFGPFLLAACAIPRFCVAFLNSPVRPRVVDRFLWAGLLAAVIAVAYSSATHPGAEGRKKADEAGTATQRNHQNRLKEAIRSKGQLAFFAWCLVPLCLSAMFLTTFWVWSWKPPGEGSVGLDKFILAGIGVTLLGWLLAQVWVLFKRKEFRRPYLPGVELGTGVFAGALLYFFAHLTFPALESLGESRHVLLFYACFASPAFLIAFLLAGTLFVGLSSRRSSDEDREWWARMGAWVLVVSVAWSVLSAWVLLGPLVFFKAKIWIGSMGGISGLVTLILAHSGVTAANFKTGQKKNQQSKLAQYCLALAAPVFLASILAALSMVVGWLLCQLATLPASDTSVYRRLIGITDLSGIQPWTESGYWEVVERTLRRLSLNFIFLMLALGGIASLLININRFSLHAVYRNRLVRAYLGASNPRRKPNKFSGFDPDDNLAFGSLRTQNTESQRPLHLVNMALNLVGGKELAWQQRKAETFTASKLFTGNFRLGFRATTDYASSEMNRGLTLGTAMAISGAAANPNMGYHSSPIVAFLMTLFNVRLGCWLGNPGAAGYRTYRKAAPDLPVYYAAREALGLSDDTSPFVCLSDGGHFENLGLYEMILRRCRKIVVCDAGCDPSCALEDLGNAIRKVRADLGVEIRIPHFSIYSRDDKRYDDTKCEEIGRYCAVGHIYYEPGSQRPDGTIVYIKPAICGREPKDVFNYKQLNQLFPHESTADQFFSEAQFESYRALGGWIIERIYEDHEHRGKGLDGFIAAAQRYSI